MKAKQRSAIELRLGGDSKSTSVHLEEQKREGDHRAAVSPSIAMSDIYEKANLLGELVFSQPPHFFGYLWKDMACFSLDQYAGYIIIRGL